MKMCLFFQNQNNLFKISCFINNDQHLYLLNNSIGTVIFAKKIIYFLENSRNNFAIRKIFSFLFEINRNFY